MSVLEIIGFITTLLAIWLATREHVLTWPLQLIASLLYVYLFVDAHLFGESVLQFIYAALAIYGWWCWRKPKTNEVVVPVLPVSRLTRQQWLLYNGLGIAGTLIVSQLQVNFLPTDVPYLDSTLFVFGLIAQWMQARKQIENWPYWIVLDVIGAGVYLHKALYLTAVLYLVLAALAAWGWRQWRRDLQAQA
ncbi:nicotinamide riboside transporter PnuC [Amantichitinum ursilacus]|uniref:Nicotinamide riboside transporter PnuC n=1 Tax=Amantichitinum ursilacus TaxID=857265 RepID=A0A0N0XH54_9NEIS|nr:nicotinamide riboside transporter PnuC [Amantichitinum ursilacus]KPC49189.1 Nicotinamide riboside transporter PnuC [Amantichitinum ursilacus]